MILLIDSGNTRLKWCWFDGDDFPLNYESAGYDQLDKKGAKLFDSPGPDIEQVYVCNVAGETIQKQLSEVFSRWTPPPIFLASKALENGVSNAYIKPQALGVDRWMALQGAWSLCQDAVCIVDCGTAVTVDVMNDLGQHLGGMVIPGLELMREMLLTGTDGIRFDEESGSVEGLMARDTDSAVIAGTLYAVVALIDRIYRDLSTEIVTTPRLLISGGDAEEIRPLLSDQASYEPMLVFQGMLTVIEQQT